MSVHKGGEELKKAWDQFSQTVDNPGVAPFAKAGGFTGTVTGNGAPACLRGIGLCTSAKWFADE